MHSEPSHPYTLRQIHAGDAETIARQRALMFEDMGEVSTEESEALFAASVPWFKELLEDGLYVGWLALDQTEVVAGGGIHLRETGPLPGFPRTGRAGHIANIYTAPAHRRRGLARLLMETMLAWSEENQLVQLTLVASQDGRNLYQNLGFIPSNDMRRVSTRK